MNHYTYEFVVKLLIRRLLTLFDQLLELAIFFFTNSFFLLVFNFAVLVSFIIILLGSLGL